jgi:hypothetical protein
VVYDRPSFTQLIHEIGTPATTPSLPERGLAPDADAVWEAFAAHDVEVVGGSIEAGDAAALLAAV